MYEEILIVAAIATAIAIASYLIALWCTRSYAGSAAQLPADDEQRKNALANLLATLKFSVRWGTLMGILYLLLGVALWFFGATEQQAVIVNYVGGWGCGMLLASLVCHFCCTWCLSAMSGATEQPGFLTVARKMIIRMLVLGVIAIVLHLFVAY